MGDKQSTSGDFVKIAKILREEAATVKRSFYNSRWGWAPERQHEYDELRRLSKVASAMASQLR